ncbi:hypothetical protein [Pseudarthrobacter raffinosi]|uniref:hypothetical protein n=1 Tax=Pseudarthrobacter raffinosi TaxID=2953651 RepID=UPI00208F4D9C|nr:MULTISPECIES: hypothetical protein [unclassified Pseudarthrobacter]MCO4237472.1 hypothetical protein [Pseudarthrobacter sp. MDT3-28]MCO4252431.1 hypothetical protein [Pseudarthrobacter sp. MDT3-9]MCO4262783.1 hypothetical protein [Pseudarthrobacter sp. MDT3-26]
MRTNHARPPFHFLRAASLSTGILTLAAGAHVAGGGDLPAPGILLAVLALTVLAATTATRLRLNFPAMLTVLGAGQFILHEAFTVFSSSGTAVSAAASGLHNAHLAGAAAPVIAATGHVHDAGSAGILMLLTHALATGACALLLAKGEAALWALAAWLRPLVRLPEAVTPDAGTPRAVTAPPAVLPLRPWRNLRQHSRRGPPSAVVLS